jgi:hypothetical protein
MAACAAMDGQLTAARDSWRGASYDQVVAAWGAPARSVRDTHTWISVDDVPQAKGAGGGAGAVLFGGSGEAARCERTLMFENARVARAGDWAGNPEFCRRFARRT